jgi:3-phosphoshikimate 1-carboxyvinyltransferase
MGAKIVANKNEYLPLEIAPVNFLQSITYAMPIASAQVKSCLLLAGLYAAGIMRVNEPQLTRDHTERMLPLFGADVVREKSTLQISMAKQLTTNDIVVPGDISSAAFFIVAACLVPDSDLTIKNVGVNPLRMGVVNVLKKMGADIQINNTRVISNEPIADLHVRYKKLHAVTVNAEHVPSLIDEIPVLAIAAATANGITTIQSVEELKHKETNRILAIIDGLQVLGVHSQFVEGNLEIHGADKLLGGPIKTCGDHRIAMAFFIAGLATEDSLTIDDEACICSSFPSFGQFFLKAKL